MKALAALGVIIAFVVGYAISWGVIVGIIKLITLCFGLPFSILPATGIWLILCLLCLVFKQPAKEKK